MAKKKPASPVLAALRKASANEAAAYAFLEAQRWGDKPACPLCGSVDVYAMKDRKTGEREKNYRWRCRDCGKMYSVRTGTVMEETRIRVNIWVHAFWRACASKKGISAHQLARECEITPKSALYVMHRIRLAMVDDPTGQPLLGGVIEADETFVGGRPRYKTNKREAARLRRDNKQILFAMLERGGRVRATHVDRIHAGNLREALRENVAQERYAGREVMFLSDRLIVPNVRVLLGPKMHPVLGRSRLTFGAPSRRLRRAVYWNRGKASKAIGLSQRQRIVAARA